MRFISEIKKGEASDLAVKWDRRRLVVLVIAFGGNNVHAMAAFVEHDLAIREREQGPVAPGADVAAGDELGAALADDDATGRDELPAKSFYAQSLANAVAPVTDAALTFLMCHIP